MRPANAQSPENIRALRKEMLPDGRGLPFVRAEALLNGLERKGLVRRAEDLDEVRRVKVQTAKGQ